MSNLNESGSPNRRDMNAPTQDASLFGTGRMSLALRDVLAGLNGWMVGAVYQILRW